MTTVATAETALGDAKHAWQHRNAAEADRLCREILAADPDNAPALHLLAEIRLSAAPDSPITNLLMAHALRRLGRALDAVPHARVLRHRAFQCAAV